jgi:aspartate/methionine/tyrosine aminotransferase
VVVTCGSTEAMAATFLALVEPGQEVVFLEPFYENYGPDAYLSGAVPKSVPMGRPGWTVDIDRLRDAITSRTRAMVLTNPHNPTGRVFGESDLRSIADLVVERDLLVFTDEIYEHILYDGRSHCSIALLDGMGERTVTISALSKSYSVTGWRVGWAVATRTLIDPIRKVHDFLTVAAPAPLQEAGVTALNFPEAYYRELTRSYHARRDLFFNLTEGTGFAMTPPEGAYYAMAEIGALRERIGAPDDTEFCRRLILEAGVAAVPGSSFFSDPADGRDLIRFAFAKRLETLREAGGRLAAFDGGDGGLKRMPS